MSKSEFAPKNKYGQKLSDHKPSLVFIKGVGGGAFYGVDEEGRLCEPKIGRSEFLSARMGYLNEMRFERSFAKMIDACNLDDEMQVRLLLMTWDDHYRAATRK